LDFGGRDTDIFGHVNVVGNVGVRVVRTGETSDGSVAYPSTSNLTSLLTYGACGTALPSNVVVNPACYLTPNIIAFANGGSSPNTYKASHINTLPSFNVRFGLDDKDFIRFAYSRAISRPEIGDLRNFIQMNAPVINVSPDSPYVVYNSPTAARVPANVIGYNFVFNANAGNAALLPEMADQFDLSYERYFGSSSAFTVDLFFKKLSNSLSYDNFGRTFTNNGATEIAQIRGPVNQRDGGRIKGFEIAYQTFFDFLDRKSVV